MPKDIWVVASQFKEDVVWLKESDFPVVLISKNQGFADSSFFACHSTPNRGMEFGSYLWFICNYWDSIPERVAFIHGHEFSYHQSVSILDAIDMFGDSDFHGLNGPRHSACHYFFEGLRHPWFLHGFSEMWSFLGLSDICAPPKRVACQGGTQCIVSRDRIKSRPRRFYERMLQGIMGNEDHYILALVLEISWHIIFGVQATDPSMLVPQFDEHCLTHRDSILLTSPNLLWSSYMKNSINFKEIDSHSEWVEFCMELLKTFARPTA
jgi:hypothetical protein